MALRLFCLMISTILVLSRTSLAFVCSNTGIFTDPQDCTAFYVCDESLQEARGSCSLLGTFSNDTQTCVVGTCLDLSENPVVTTTTTTTTKSRVRASKDGTLSTNIETMITAVTTLVTNSTVTRTSSGTLATTSATTTTSTDTTIASTTTPVTESTVAVTNTTTAATTTTVATTTTATMVCTTSGQTFADPTNCQKYYQCDSTLKLVSQSCWLPALQHYESASNGCVFGSC